MVFWKVGFCHTESRLWLGNSQLLGHIQNRLKAVMMFLLKPWILKDCYLWAPSYLYQPEVRSCNTSLGNALHHHSSAVTFMLIFLKFCCCWPPKLYLKPYHSFSFSLFLSWVAIGWSLWWAKPKRLLKSEKLLPLKFLPRFLRVLSHKFHLCCAELRGTNVWVNLGDYLQSHT